MLRKLRPVVDQILNSLLPRFTPMYAWVGRPSLPSEELSTIDQEARLYRKLKGSEANLAYLGPMLTENRNGLLVDTMVTQAGGTAKRDAARLMASRIPSTKPMMLRAGKNYHTRDLVRDLRQMAVWRHAAQNAPSRASVIDGRTIRHASNALS